MEEKKVILTKQQEEAKDLIVKWFNYETSKDNQIFTLAGYAGTGKSFLISHIVLDVLGLNEDSVAYITPTGKAASVLVKRGIKNASTIHRLIYIAEDSDELDAKGKPKPKFTKKKEIPPYKLIVLDEVSMVSDYIMKDLLSFDIPVLCCGDPGQLPPIMSKQHDLLQHPNYTLTDIVRQAEDNPIIQVATLARTSNYIQDGRYGDDVIVIHRDRLKDEDFNKLLLKADQVICGKNDTRIKINNYMRKLLNHTSDTPEDGEKIICCMNNYDIPLDKNGEYPLVNGLIGEIKDYNDVNDKESLCTFKFKPDFLPDFTEMIIGDSGGFKENDFVYDRHQKVYELDNGQITKQRSLFTKIKKENEEEYKKYKKEVAIEMNNRKRMVNSMQIGQFFYGYCISVHKSQGSEWDKIVILDESKTFSSCKDKWLYTAITRAKKKLVIIRL